MKVIFFLFFTVLVHKRGSFSRSFTGLYFLSFSFIYLGLQVQFEKHITLPHIAIQARPKFKSNSPNFLRFHYEP